MTNKNEGGNTFILNFFMLIHTAYVGLFLSPSHRRPRSEAAKMRELKWRLSNNGVGACVGGIEGEKGCQKRCRRRNKCDFSFFFPPPPHFLLFLLSAAAAPKSMNPPSDEEKRIIGKSS